MVQREVADRFFAKPSTKAYGAVSVLVQLVAERTGFHPVSAAVFRPRPNVDSALVAFRRTGLPPDFRRVKRVVEGSFAHRRKRLANSLELAGVAARGPAEEAIALDRPSAERSRRRARAPRVPRACRGLEVTRAPAAAKINLSLVVGPAVRTESTRSSPSTSVSRSPTASRWNAHPSSVSTDSPTTRSFAARSSA